MIKQGMQQVFDSLGIGLTSYKQLDRLRELELDIPQLIDLMSQSDVIQGDSKAQLHQDVIVLLATAFKKNGFFVEFGATDGIYLSNSYLLEKEYGWQGILSEPAKVWHKDLSQNRKAHIDHLCVWSKTGSVVSFNMVDSPELSTVSGFDDSDHHKKSRKHGEVYDVETISLVDLLEKYDAPREIDYLSIDTEGSEFEIMEAFDFGKYDISIITCEHNFTSNRKKIFELLTAQGYTRKFVGLSKWDDWYFRY